LKRIKVAYIVSDIDKALSFEWVAIHLSNKFELFFIIIGKENSQLLQFLKLNNILVYEVADSKNPSWISKWFTVFKTLLAIKPQVVHTHLWKANMIGLSASWLLQIEKRIHTRHHAMVHYREFKKGRKWDVLCNFLSTHIIAISENVRNILIEYDKVNPSKIRLIHHGFDFSYFESNEKNQDPDLRLKYHLSETAIVIGVIARYLEWKGIQYIIPAFRKLQNEFPFTHLVLANANGNYKSRILEALSIFPEKSFTEIDFENDLVGLYKMFDVYVHAPIDSESEAFGQTYVEALACKVPSIFTLSGVAPEFIVDHQNALVVPFQDSDAIYSALRTILIDQSLRERLIKNGRESINMFSLRGMINALEDLYSN
jgi:glycosyltransferase involved in cell wall biosynthesis